jgi:hypothetical protein
LSSTAAAALADSTTEKQKKLSLNIEEAAEVKRLKWADEFSSYPVVEVVVVVASVGETRQSVREPLTFFSFFAGWIHD